MTTIDPSTNLGKLRLALADWSDLPVLPDSVYIQTLSDNNDNLQKCKVVLGSYILGIFSQGVHRRMSVQLEVWGGEKFDQYKQYLLMIVKDPSFSGLCPIPYSGSGDSPHEIIQFISDYKKNFPAGTQSQQLAFDASISPNDGSLYGPLGGN